MSSHEKARADAIAGLGIDPAALDRTPAPADLNGAPSHADAAVPLPAAVPHGGLRDLRDLVGGVVSSATSAARDFWGRPAAVAVSAPAPARTLPSFLIAAKLSGGADALGLPLRSVEAIVPRTVASRDDLLVEVVALTEQHDLPSSTVLARILAALPRTAPLEPETRPEVVARLLAAHEAEAIELRDFIATERLDYRDKEKILFYLARHIERGVQDRRIDPDEVARATWRAWRTPLVRHGLDGKPWPDHAAVQPVLLVLTGDRQQPSAIGLDPTTLAMMAGRLARPESWVLEGRAHARIVEAVEAELAARAASKAAAVEREAFLETMRVVTPRAAGLLVARRIVDTSRRLFKDPHAPDPEIRRDGYALLVGAARLPGALLAPRATATRSVMGVEVGYEVLGAFDELELSEREIERGTKARLPRFVLDGVLGAARARVAESAPRPITSFVNARTKPELRERMAILRAYLEIIADSFTPSGDPYIAPVEISVALHLGVVGLRIDPAIVANELGKRQRGADVSSIAEDGFAVARDPRTWIFTVDQAVSAT